MAGPWPEELCEVGWSLFRLGRKRFVELRQCLQGGAGRAAGGHWVLCPSPEARLGLLSASERRSGEACREGRWEGKRFECELGQGLAERCSRKARATGWAQRLLSVWLAAFCFGEQTLGLHICLLAAVGLPDAESAGS